MNRSIRHQDASGAAGSPLGVFGPDGTLLAVAPASDLGGIDTAARVESEHQLRGVEILTICHRHPDTAAVDCTVCIPLDSEDGER